MWTLRHLLVLALLAAPGGAAQAQPVPQMVQAPAAEFLTEWLEYVAWDGSHWSGRREGAGFMLQKRGTSPAAPDAAMNYMGWDAARWSSRWNGDAFQHARQGDGRVQQDSPLQFVDWSGQKWSARWDSPARKFRVRAGG